MVTCMTKSYQTCLGRSIQQAMLSARPNRAPNAVIWT
jgi:hypothetical protein